MTVLIRSGAVSPGQEFPTGVVLTMTPGDPIALPIVFDPDDGDPDERAAKVALVATLTGADWLMQARTTPGSSIIAATFTKSESVDGDVLTVVFSLTNSAALTKDDVFYFDAQVLTGPLAGLTILDGSMIEVRSDVSRPA